MKRNMHYLEPLSGAPVRKKFVVYDIESKDGPTDRAGFTRPFLVGFYDGETFQSWRDRTSLDMKVRPCRYCGRDVRGYDALRMCMHKDAAGRACEPVGWERYHLEAYRGCMDRFLRHFFTPKYNGYVIYAHNGGSFDHLFALTWMMMKRRRGYDFTVVPVASAVQQVKVIRTLDDGSTLNWTLLDSMRLLPFGLDKAAKAMGLGGKLEMDLHAPEDDPKWEEYLAVDCKVLYDVMLKFHDLVEVRMGGEVGLTAPSTAMKLFRRKYMISPIARHTHFRDCEHKTADGSTNAQCGGCFHEWVRRAYYGGRTEIFEMEGKHLHYYDINSSYVAAMLKEMPVGKRIVTEGKIDWGMRKSHIGFAEVTVHIPEDCKVPPLPHRADSGKLIFPVGEFRGVWDLDELALLSDPMVQGKILSVGRVVWIEHEPAFKEMMEALWELRDKKRHLPECTDHKACLASKHKPTCKPVDHDTCSCPVVGCGFDEGMSELGKLLGNSFYGKFGMDPNKEEIVFGKPMKKRFHEDETGRKLKTFYVTCCVCGKEGDALVCKDCEGSKRAGGGVQDAFTSADVWFRARRVDAPYVIPQIAAHITTVARICLWRHLTTAYKKRLVVVHDDQGVEVARRTVNGESGMRRELMLWRARGFAKIETEEGRVKYTDSVTADRTVVVERSGRVEIATVEELWGRATSRGVRGEKEIGKLPGYRTLAERDGESGWFPVTEIIRHKAGKKTWRVSTKHGQTQVTTDHGIMVDAANPLWKKRVAVTAEDFTRESMKFVRVRPPRPLPFTRVDLFDYVRDYRTASGEAFDRTDKYLVMGDVRIRRHYEVGTPAWEALLRLVAFYVSDGSASLPGVTTRTRYMLSFCKSNPKTMRQVKKDLKQIAPGLVVFGPHWSDTVYVVRSGTKGMACLFAALCGFKSKGKFFPSFIFSLGLHDFRIVQKMLELGDGSFSPKTPTMFTFTTTSQKLAAGVSFLFAQHDVGHGFWFRKDKGAWLIRTTTRGENKRYDVKAEVFEANPNDYVYDFSVEGAHTFADGIGQVLLHNTDSTLTNVEMRSSKALGDLKDEYPGELLDGQFIQPKVYLLTKDKPFAKEHGPECVDKECKGCARTKVAMKGLPKKQRTAANLALLRQGEEVAFSRLEKIRTLAGTGFSRPPAMVPVKKRIVSAYDKRVVNDDGVTTRAIRLSLSDEAAE